VRGPLPQSLPSVERGTSPLHTPSAPLGLPQFDPQEKSDKSSTMPPKTNSWLRLCCPHPSPLPQWGGGHPSTHPHHQFDSREKFDKYSSVPPKATSWLKVKRRLKPRFGIEYPSGTGMAKLRIRVLYNYCFHFELYSNLRHGRLSCDRIIQLVIFVAVVVSVYTLNFASSTYQHSPDQRGVFVVCRQGMWMRLPTSPCERFK